MLRLRDAALGDIKLDATGLASIKAFLDYYWKSGAEEVVAPKQAATEDDVRRLTAELAKRYGLHITEPGSTSSSTK